MRYMFMRYPEGKTKAVTFSYDDGVPQDIRLVSLFDKYSLKATFNFNGTVLRNYNFTKEQINELFLSKGHEIAIHGLNHRANGHARPAQGIHEVLMCRLELEERCGGIVRGMAYPDTGVTAIGAAGDYANVKRYLEDLDIAYARTLGGDNDSFMLPLDFHAWMPTAHHYNPKIFEYIDKFLALDLDKITLSRRMPRLFYLWGHSYEFDVEGNSWDHMEQICKKLSGKEDTWYATNIEIHDYVKAYDALVYSADGKTVYNPTATTLWFDVDKTVYKIAPGQTVRIEEK